MIENELLTSFPQLGDLDRQSTKLLLGDCAGKKLRRGPVAVEQAKLWGSALFLLSGRLRFYLSSNDGKTVTVFHAGAGELCALPVEVACAPWNGEMQVEAERETIVASVGEETIRSLCAREPRFADFVHQATLRFVQSLLGVIHQISFQTVDVRLCHMLLELGAENHVIKVTQSGLAADLGVTREFVCKKLQIFEDAGAITMTRGKIVLRDREFLESYSQDPASPPRRPRASAKHA